MLVTPNHQQKPCPYVTIRRNAIEKKETHTVATLTLSLRPLRNSNTIINQRQRILAMLLKLPNEHLNLGLSLLLILRLAIHHHRRRHQRAHHARNPFRGNCVEVLLLEGCVRLATDIPEAAGGDLVVDTLRREGPEAEFEHGVDGVVAQFCDCGVLGEFVGAVGRVVNFFPLDPAIWFWEGSLALTEREKDLKEVVLSRSRAFCNTVP